MTPKEQLALYAEALTRYRHDPLGFVLWAFPWGISGTALEEEDGPDVWQRAELTAIGEHLKAEVKARTYAPYRGATSSGHGIGKSAETGFVVCWALMTCPNAKGVVTANSDTQLRTKTWAEVSKWFDLHCQQFPIAKSVFECTATAFRSKHNPTGWAINAIPNNPRNPAAFAGMHNAGSRVLMLVDEASEIEDPIWDTIEGALTDADTELIALAYGNPTKVTGRFRDMVIGKLSLRNGGSWRAQQIDSRTVKRTNKAELAKWAEAWGEDSDFFRVRVRGLFPRSGSKNLIPTDFISAARKREVQYDAFAPLVAGLDCARFGNDSSRLTFRQGRDARSIPSREWKGMDTQELAADVNRLCLENGVHTLFVDVGGLGAGVFDRLIVLANQSYSVIPVDFGGKGGVSVFNGVQARVKNKRASMYVELYEWLKLGCIEDNNDLENELAAIEYGYAGSDGSEIILEPKDMLKKRLGFSPDWSDSLALTFGAPVAPHRRTVRGEVDRGRSFEAQSVASGEVGFDQLMNNAYKGWQ